MYICKTLVTNKKKMPVYVYLFLPLSIFLAPVKTSNFFYLICKKYIFPTSISKCCIMVDSGPKEQWHNWRKYASNSAGRQSKILDLLNFANAPH